MYLSTNFNTFVLSIIELQNMNIRTNFNKTTNCNVILYKGVEYKRLENIINDGSSLFHTISWVIETIRNGGIGTLGDDYNLIHYYNKDNGWSNPSTNCLEIDQPAPEIENEFQKLKIS